MKQEIVNNGELAIDPQLTKEEWKQILLDDNFMSNNYKYALLIFYLEPEHKASFNYLAEKYNTTTFSISGFITQFSARVPKRLNRDVFLSENGETNFWLTTMTSQKANEKSQWQLRPELVEAMTDLDYANSNDLKIDSLATLVNYINKDLSEFIKKFRTIRKKLSNKKKRTTAGLLFKLNDDKRDWSINEGGHNEIQYHLYLRDNQVGYGLGFNAQYVQFNNDETSLELIKPFIKTFLSIQDSEEVETLKNRGFEIDLDALKSMGEGGYNLFGRTINLKGSDNDKLPLLDYYSMLNDLKGDLFALYEKIFDKANELKSIAKNNNNENQKMDERSHLFNEIIQLLESNKNIILTGAPGTGKTYLAKQVAQALDAIKEFVQFHPSYDYTDFVEGLRPIQDDDGEVGFELRDGIFKAFCKKAIKSQTSFNSSNFEEVYTLFVDEVIENGLSLTTPTHYKPFDVEINSKKSCVAIPKTNNAKRMVLTQDNIQTYLETNQLKGWKPYVKPVGDYIKDNYDFKLERSTADSSQKYLIILDEINRAEISKVLGELFFAIDPGYRGKEGRVETQYTNMIPDDDIFKEGFYIPENVYIIGTMNDIDRSVESFDFAMRRRFAWKEIKAKDRLDMWEGQIDDWIEEATWRLVSLNKAIEETQGLNSAYHVGPAYFLKLANYDGDFEALWKHHLAPLLFEYLRGYPDVDEQLENLKNAYDKVDTDASND